MNQEDAGRLALGAILGVIAAVAITKTGLSPRESILRFLIFAVVAGIVVNTQEGKRMSFLLLASVLSAFVLVGTFLWLAVLGEGVIPAISGKEVNLVDRLPFAATLLTGIWIISAISVFVCALARPMTLGLFRNALSLDVDKAKSIETLLKVFVSIGGTAYLLISSIL